MTLLTIQIDSPSLNNDSGVTGNELVRKEQALGRIAKNLSSMKSKELECVAEYLETNTKEFDASNTITNEFADKLGCNQVTDEEGTALELAVIKEFFDWRQNLLKDSLTAPKVAELLGTSRQTPHDRLKNGSLVAIRDNGTLKFPIWQFDPEGPDGVFDGLPEVLKTLKMPIYSKISWLTRANLHLGGLTPIEALRRRQKAEVIAESKTVGVI
jgi:hypothetical protein